MILGDSYKIRVVHTSDWHIGKCLHSQKRYEEFEAFFNWLVEILSDQKIDILLIAGDIFDSSAPSNKAQNLYYRFLYNAAGYCRHIVITGGNHDSPSFLNAPKDLLRGLNVHVIGSAAVKYEEEVLVLKDKSGRPEIIVCAVPYLRDRDIRSAEPGESLEDKEKKLLEGITKHYHKVCSAAQKKRKQLNIKIPIIAMGHLFAAGGKTVEGDGVRELYAGSLSRVPKEIFPDFLDYTALGHLHSFQRVGGSDKIRYCGSPIQMSFNEAKQQKKIIVAEFSGREPLAISSIDVPKFRNMQSIKGGWDQISASIKELKYTGKETWVEIIYEGEEIAGDLRQRIEQAAGSNIKILKIKNNRALNLAIQNQKLSETLEDLDIYEVFERCINQNNVTDKQKKQLRQTYEEAVSYLQLEDSNY